MRPLSLRLDHAGQYFPHYHTLTRNVIVLYTHLPQFTCAGYSARMWSKYKDILILTRLRL